MKILDKYILKTFAITFTSVFVILFFIFILQTVWLFISELAGKDLDVVLIFKFLLFKMPSLFPLVLPLSVLLSSIMTFGDLSENYEFAAMKSAGISLQRTMKSLFFLILGLSLAAFFFANNVIPFAEYKFINFRKDIAQMKPAMAIAEGQFSDVGNYNIKVDKKSGENGNLLKGITIHKKSNNFDGSKNVIKAKTGELISNKKSNILKLVLNDGFYYEDIVPKKYEERKNLPFAKSSFKKYIINIDLSKLNNSEGQDYKITNTNTMLNLNELKYTIDSLNKSYKKDILSFTENIYQRTGVANRYGYNPEIKKTVLKPNLLSNFNPKEQSEILNFANNTIVSSSYSIDASKTEMEAKQKVINSHWIALYDKFVIAFACILMFFIGAPLGAIIRKGGLGLPMVFAVLIFIIYHFINTFGKKVAQENGITPFLGCWMSSIVLTPIAILLTYRATNDIGLINIDVLLLPFQKLLKKIFPPQN
ncbi:LptF/LptG family permease [Flavobacterium psychrotolerans]|uniref:Permease n=1 Tax=Flavobacterium psychrotolerans TaxID=2169410 RepID=A0A2U1JHH4_9FLAO|nr:LptF/LptG family permease [Flavobacterium psychrotolerans]PWA04586.1 permease [Flavobacterium psychrotolerans]